MTPKKLLIIGPDPLSHSPVQPRPQPTAQNWFSISWNLGTRHLFSYLCINYSLVKIYFWLIVSHCAMVQPRLTRGVPVVQNEPHLTKHVQRPSVEARRSGRHKLWPISLESAQKLTIMYFLWKIRSLDFLKKILIPLIFHRIILAKVQGSISSADLCKNYFSHYFFA